MISLFSRLAITSALICGITGCQTTESNKAAIEESVEVLQKPEKSMTETSEVVQQPDLSNTSDLAPTTLFDQRITSIEIGGFKFHSTPKEALEIMQAEGYQYREQENSPALIEDLLSDPPKYGAIGKAIRLEKIGKEPVDRYEIDLRFNDYLRIETITEVRFISSKDNVDILDNYLMEYPWLSFKDHEDGEDFDPATNKTTKITNSNYYYKGYGYSYMHINHLRKHAEDGSYLDRVSLNAHEGNFAAVQGYNRAFTVPDHDDDHGHDQEHEHAE
jgi:hypothetical protein